MRVACTPVRDLPAGRQARPPTAQISVQLGVQIGDRPGIIAVTGSPAGDLGLPMSAPNSAAKAALRLFLDTCRTELAATHIDLVARYHGFTNTAALDPEDVPVQAFIIAADRAAREMAWALERRRAHHLFPKRIALLIGLARLLPEPVRRRVLQGAA